MRGRSSSRSGSYRSVLRGIGLIAVTLMLWETVVRLSGVPRYILPSFSAVIGELVSDSGGFTAHALVTLAESLVGLVLAAVAAFTIGIACFMSQPLERLLMPAVVGFKAVPLIALAPLFILWFGNGFLSKAIMAATICFFPILVGIVRGFRSLSDDEVFFLRSIRLSRLEELLAFRLFKAVPLAFAGVRVSSALAVVGAIVAEFTGAKFGLGYILIVGSVRIDTPLLFAGILLSALSGLVLFGATSLVERSVMARLHMDVLEE